MEQMELSATGILSLLETTKAQRTSFVDSIVTSLKDGTADPLKVHLQIKNTEDLVKQMTDNKEYRALCLDEAQKYGKSFERFNAKFQVKEVGTKYDWSACNDAELQRLEWEAETAAKALKNRQEFLKKAPQDGVIVTNEQTGETEKIYPPSKSSTTSVAVTLK